MKPIKSKEVRIGNLVQDRNGFVMRVVSIHDDGTIYCDFEGNEGDVWEFDSNDPCFGVELTEEILFKCSFETSPWDSHSTFRCRFCNDGCIVILLEHNYIEIGDLTLDIEIRYLHELQNLYFALTGEELEINF